MIESIPPGAILLAGAVLAPLLRGRLRQAFLLLLPLLGGAQLWLLPDGFFWSVRLFSYDLTLVRVDKLSLVFGTVFYAAAFLSFVYALHVRDALQDTAALVYVGSAIGATFAGDLVTLFIFWELTAVASVLLIWARRSERAYRAGLRYLIVQIASGVLLLAGAIVHYAKTGSLAFGPLGLESPGGMLIFLAFGIKAAFPLLHNWLQDAYPEATITGTVFLSAFTTKLAIYALARGFAGTDILIPIGAAMTAFPIFYALIENDLRRVLAYGLNNQLGFMVVGVGIGTEFALNGTAAHAFAHVIYKGLLFMSMGAVLLRAGTIKATDLGGLYKSMPWTMAFCLVGVASISAFPLFSGFVSKSLIVTAAAKEHYTATFFVLLFATAGALLPELKVPFFAFFARDRGIRVKEAPLNMLVAMGAAAALCFGLGVHPKPLYAMLPFPVAYEPYTATHVVTSLQLLLFSALAFAVLMRTGIYPAEQRAVNLDSDWIYRRAAPRLLEWTASASRRAWDGAAAWTRGARDRALDEVTRHHRPSGALGEPWPTGATAMWAALLLGIYLLLYYL